MHTSISTFCVIDGVFSEDPEGSGFLKNSRKPSFSHWCHPERPHRAPRAQSPGHSDLLGYSDYPGHGEILR